MLLLVPQILISQDSPSGDSSIIPANSRIVKIFDGGKGFLEGPVMSSDGILYVTDVGRYMNTGHIWQINPDTKEASVFLSPSGKACGMTIDKENRIVITQGAEHGGQKIIRIDLDTRLSEILTATYNDLPYNAPNDIVIDNKDRLYFTDPSFFRFLSYEPVYQPVQGVYRIDTDNSVHRIIADAVTPNGITISPDQKTIYVTSTDVGSLKMYETEGLPIHIAPRAVYAYDLLEDGTVINKRTLIENSVDGMSVDVDGNIYASLLFEKRIGIFSPSGEEVGTIPLPQGPTNVAFGKGKYSKTLFITCGKNLYMIEILKEGFHF